MNIKEIVSDKTNQSLRNEVSQWSHKNNVGLAQAYSGVIGRVQEEYPKYEPYSSFESFYQMLYRKHK